MSRGDRPMPPRKSPRARKCHGRCRSRRCERELIQSSRGQRGPCAARMRVVFKRTHALTFSTLSTVDSSHPTSLPPSPTQSRRNTSHVLGSCFFRLRRQVKTATETGRRSHYKQKHKRQATHTTSGIHRAEVPPDNQQRAFSRPSSVAMDPQLAKYVRVPQNYRSPGLRNPVPAPTQTELGQPSSREGKVSTGTKRSGRETFKPVTIAPIQGQQSSSRPLKRENPETTESAQPSIRAPSGASSEDAKHELRPAGDGGKRDDPAPSVHQPSGEEETFGIASSAWSTGPVKKARTTVNRTERMLRHASPDGATGVPPSAAPLPASPVLPGSGSSIAATDILANLLHDMEIHSQRGDWWAVLDLPHHESRKYQIRIAYAKRRAFLDLYESSMPGNEPHLTRRLKDCVKIVDEAGRKLEQFASAFDRFKKAGPPGAQE
ncbi:hypothetical protein V8E36_009282 [Tilletia maclaganii]